MKRKWGMANGEWGQTSSRPRCAPRLTLPPSPFPIPPSAFQPPHSASSRQALTLIELLVTIVILVTVLGAVLPLVSPNNDARKIREASRQLTSLFAQAQAQAARDGRPVGVGFVDTWTDNDDDGNHDPGEQTGMALEAFLIAEPPPFAGFNSDAAVYIPRDPSYHPPQPTDPNEPPLLNVQFGHGVGGEGFQFSDDPGDLSDAIPPQMFRGRKVDENNPNRVLVHGDFLEIGQELFEIVQDDYDDEQNDDVQNINGVDYMAAQKVLTVRWLTWRYRDIQLAPQGGKSYRLRRRPMAEETPSRTSAEAIQFPRGVGVDFDPTDGNTSLSVLFSPTGAIDSVYVDGRKDDDREMVFIMLGLTENANPPTGDPPPDDIDYTRYDFSDVPDDEDGNDVLRQRRQEVNLLNLDSRWIAVAPSGRVVGAENQIFDPREERFTVGDPDNPIRDLNGNPIEGTDPDDQRDRQRRVAQEFAEQLRSDSAP